MACPEKPRHCLLVVDLQNDFVSGTLAVPDALSIVPVVNAWMQAFAAQGWPIVLSRDWHPANHCSFKAQGGRWPSHCVQHSAGADFHVDMQQPAYAYVVNKALLSQEDCYSAWRGEMAYSGERAAQWFANQQITDVWVMGLALDYCVQATAEDIAAAGLRCHVVAPGCRAIDLNSVASMQARCQSLGVDWVNNAQIHVSLAPEVDALV